MLTRKKFAGVFGSHRTRGIGHRTDLLKPPDIVMTFEYWIEMSCQ